VQCGTRESGRLWAGFNVHMREKGEGVRTLAALVCSDRIGLSIRASWERNADYMVPSCVREVRCQRVRRAADSLAFKKRDARQSSTQPRIQRPSSRSWASDIRALRPITRHSTIPNDCLTCKRNSEITQAVTLGLVSS